jgi:SAM-dependent methyltransferase
MNDTLKRWEALHAQSGFEPVYPTDSVIRWTFRQFPRGSSAKLLDIGAGHGRHALFWARQGHLAFAIDAAVTAVDACHSKAADAGLSVDCRIGGATEVPFPDQSFDGVLSFGVLYYLPWADWQKAFDEIRRVLRPGGSALLVVRSKEDSRCLTGEAMDDHTWRLTSPPNCPWPAEAAIPMTFVDAQELAQLSAAFTSTVLDKMQWSDRGGMYWNSDWLVQLTR